VPYTKTHIKTTKIIAKKEKKWYFENIIIILRNKGVLL